MRLTMRILLIVVCMSAIGCVSNYKTFGDWYVGAYWTKDHEEGIDVLEGKRPSCYGHFRLPEIIFQPSGGLAYPEHNAGEFLAHVVEPVPADTSLGPFGHADFLIANGGIFDVIPYRELTADTYCRFTLINGHPSYIYSNRQEKYKLGDRLFNSAIHPIATGVAVGSRIWIRVPLYAVHDAVKTLMIPGALLYYWSKGYCKKGDEDDQK